jgi:hypothetical protein
MLKIIYFLRVRALSIPNTGSKLGGHNNNMSTSARRCNTAHVRVRRHPIEKPLQYRVSLQNSSWFCRVHGIWRYNACTKTMLYCPAMYQFILQ